MFFQKKLDATMDWVKNRNEEDVEIEERDPYMEYKEKNQIELESKDMVALYISALLVFSPIFIILILILKWSSNI